MTTGCYCAIIPFFSGGKIKTTKKQRLFMTGLSQVCRLEAAEAFTSYGYPNIA